MADHATNRRRSHYARKKHRWGVHTQMEARKRGYKLKQYWHYFWHGEWIEQDQNPKRKEGKL